jgi:hypothetical protein
MAVLREKELCQELPRALRELTQDVVSKDPALAGTVQLTPYNVGDLGGARAVFPFDSPDEIAVRIGQLQTLNLESDSENEQIREILASIDSLPVDFRADIAPVRESGGERIWSAEFRGDPSVLSDFNLGEDPSMHCSPAELVFRVSMPAPITEYSPHEGLAIGTLVSDHIVEWRMPRAVGDLVLKVAAAEPNGDKPLWYDTQFWIAIVTLVTAVIGALTAWRSFRSKGR